MDALFPEKIVYDDEQSICDTLFEAVLFEDANAGVTPFRHFIERAPLSRTRNGSTAHGSPTRGTSSLPSRTSCPVKKFTLPSWPVQIGIGTELVY